MSPLPPFPGATNGRHGLPDMLSALWTKYLPLMRERLQVLDLAAGEAQHGGLSPQQTQEAIDAAHKFAGSLGMFGFAEGTDAARSIEHHLLGAEPFDPIRLQTLVARLHSILDL